MIRDWLRPSLWWLHALMVAAVVACVFGGLWQFGIYGDRKHEGASDDTLLMKGAFLGSPFFVPDSEGRTWVVEPFQPNDGERAALLVVRGYGERGEVPPAEASRIRVVLRPSDGIVRLPRLINETDVPLRAEYAVARTDTGLPLVPAAEAPAPWSVGFRNLAYAMQWWVFGAFAIVMWWRICNDQIKQPNGENE